jgi:hypothetical protein
MMAVAIKNGIRLTIKAVISSVVPTSSAINGCITGYNLAKIRSMMKIVIRLIIVNCPLNPISLTNIPFTPKIIFSFLTFSLFSFFSFQLEALWSAHA